MVRRLNIYETGVKV